MDDATSMTSFSELMATLRAKVVQYQLWLKSRPQQGADLEVIFKWLSYYLAGMRNKLILRKCVYQYLGNVEFVS